MLRIKITYILPILIVSLLACKQTRYVPDNSYLIKENKVILKGDKLDKAELMSIMRQPTNYKRLWIKWKLFAYNSIDSTKVAEKRQRLNIEIREENHERALRQDSINQKRIDRARAKGKTHYTHKYIALKDTVQPKRFLREWYKYKVGEPPVIFDSAAFEKTIEQMGQYLERNGYYYGKSEGIVDFKDNKKCVVTYAVTTGEIYTIASLTPEGNNQEVLQTYDIYKERQRDPPLIGKPFDRDLLDNYRYRVAKFMRDSSFYGFSASQITFEADTNRQTMKVDLRMKFGERSVRSPENRDSLIFIPHQKTTIDEVFFHIADTLQFEGNFVAYMDSLGLSPYRGPFLNTSDTLYFQSDKGSEAGSNREAVFLYNRKLFVKPRVLEMNNYLEKGDSYSEKSAEASYSSLLRMNLFKAIKTELVEIPGTNKLQVHYYLAPTKKQSYSFQPRATNTNGYLGVSASVSYTNRNLFRGAEQLTLSLSGGFESQPPVFEETIDGEQIQTAGRSFNTLEIGPSVKLTLPGLFPLRMSQISKKHRPQTIISTAYSYQKRSDFERGSYQLNYQWKFIMSKTSLFEIGLPGVSVVKYVNINKTQAFEDRLNALGDLFLINAYSNQFVWQDWRIRYEYNIKEKANRTGDAQVYFTSVFDPAGNILSAFKKYQDTVSNGQFALAGVGYSQFIRLDNTVLFSKPLGKERSVNFKMDLGAGIPYGNTKTSMPYDYSFFGGGANDNRGWRARTLGPGGYKYYLDTLRSATQIGDLRIGGYGEFRFAINSFFKGAVFVDAGNIWTVDYDDKRPGGQISADWWRQIAVATGVGLRMDLEYFIIRFDIGFPIRNPALPNGEQWIFQKKDQFIQEGIDAFGVDNYKSIVPKPYIPNIHFGIGYPF